MDDRSTSLDLTGVLPRLREKKLAQAFSSTTPGCAFMVVNDYDPKVFIESFLESVHEPASWSYLERGSTWKVRVERRAPSPCGDAPGAELRSR